MGVISGRFKDDRSSKALRIVGYVYFAIVVFVAGFYIWGQLLDYDHFEDYFAGDCADLRIAWTYEASDGTGGEIVMPADLGLGRGTTVTLTAVLPGTVTDGQYLCFLTSTDMRIFVDGEERCVFDGTDNPIPGGYVKSHYITMELSAEDAGRSIVIERNNTQSNNSAFNTVYIGDQIGIALKIVGEHGIQFAAAGLLLVLSVMGIIIGYILLAIYKHKIPVICLCYGTALIALWVIFDSFLYQLIFRGYHMDGPMEYLLILHIPFYFALYLNYEQERRYEMIYAVCYAVCALIFVVLAVVHFAGIRSYEDNLIYTGVSVGIGTLCLLGTIAADCIRDKIRSYTLVAVGLGFVCAFGIVQSIAMNLITDYHDAPLLILGLYVLLILSMVHTLLKINREEEEDRRAKQASEYKTRFMTNMSHEIRTPITTILGMNEMIRRESGEESIRKYSANIEEAGNNLMALVNDVLDISRIEAGKETLSESSYSLAEMITSIDKIVAPRAIKKGLIFRKEISDEIPDHLYGDNNKVYQILMNLLANAIKYTETGSITLRMQKWALPAKGDAAKRAFGSIPPISKKPETI